MKRIEWYNVTKNRPCSICDKHDWCSISKDGKTLICRRHNNGKAKVKTDSSGGEYYLYFTDHLTREWVKPPYIQRPPVKIENRANLSILNTVYQELLNVLELSSQHQHHLITERGFCQEDVIYRGYKTIPLNHRPEITNKLRHKFSDKEILSVPGFYVKNGLITFSGQPGLAIPCRDIEGRIYAIKIRSDQKNPDKGKYQYLSSKKLNGISAISSVHYPLSLERLTKTVIVTEGELKADYCCFKYPTYTISIPGVSNLSGLIKGIQDLKVELVQIAFDSDFKSNNTVRMALINLMKMLQAENIKIEVLSWN